MQRLNIVVLIAMLSSCHRQDNVTIYQSSTEADTAYFKKEIACYDDGSVELFYLLKKQKEQQLKLDNLESGFNTLQIRIWYDYALLTDRKVIIIKLKDGKWSAECYQWFVPLTTSEIIDTIQTYNKKSVVPKSGWGKFLYELLSLKIMTLPNMGDIPGLQDDWEDGVTYNIEVSTNKQYRFYSYHMPEMFEDEFWQAKNIVQILSLISNELQ